STVTMKNLIGLCSGSLMLAMNFAAPAISADQTVHMGGFLVDETCASSEKFKPNSQAYVREHTRECSLEPACSKFGYELYSNGRWYRLDNKGIKLARQILTAIKVEAENYVTVDGTLKADKITVIQMKKTPPPTK